MQTRREGSVGAARVCERPRVLARAGRLGDDEEGEESARAVGDEVAAREEDEEDGGVVGGEELVSAGGRGKDGEVEEIGEEIGGAEVEDGVLWPGVGGGEAAVGIGEEGVSGEVDGGDAVEEGD